MASDKTDALLAELEDALSPTNNSENSSDDMEDTKEEKSAPDISSYFGKTSDSTSDDPFGSLTSPDKGGQENEEKSVSLVPELKSTPLGTEKEESQSLSPDSKVSFTTATTTDSSNDIDPYLFSAGRRKSAPRVRFLDDVLNDPFAAGFAIDPEERRHDAWLPSEPTRQLLVSIATKKIAPQSLNLNQLTRPGVLVPEVQLTTNVELNKHLQLSIPGRQDEDGVRQYILEGRYRAAIDLTGRILGSFNQGYGRVGQVSKHSPHTLRLWLTRIMLLVKIRQFTLAENELSAFGNLDNPDLYFEFYSETYPGRKGSMVSFAFRLLHAELPSRLGKHEDSLDKLYYLQAVTSRILSNLNNGYAEDGTEMKMDTEDRQASLELWTKRERDIMHCVANVFLRLKDYGSVIEVFHKLIESDPDNKSTLLSTLGRVYLQMGDLERASSCFDRSAACVDSNTEARVAFNSGLLLMGQNNFESAKQQFKDCIQLDPANHLAVNNYAVCCLYLGEMREAIRILESLLNEGYIHEGLIFNLCTLYELRSSRASAKKAAVLERIGKHCTDGFDLQCFKLP